MFALLLPAIVTAALLGQPEVPSCFFERGAHISAMTNTGLQQGGYYDAPSCTSVYDIGTASDWLRMHERCHAHQHFIILRDLGAVDFSQPHQLDQWGLTWEGWRYGQAVSASSFRWPAAWLSDNNMLEDFANACGLYFTNPYLLWQFDPIRYEAIAHVFWSGQ